MPKRKGNMQHIYVTYSCEMMHKGRSIMIKKSCNTKLIWLNCNDKGRNKESWKSCNTRLMWMKCNDKGRWMYCSIKLI